MSNPELGNVPAEPGYGEVQAIEQQEQGAPLGVQKSDNLPLPSAAEPLAEPPAADVPAEIGPSGPSPNNMVSVLPPLETAPANSAQRALRPEQQLAYLIMGTPGMSGVTRSFAAQILGKFQRESDLSALALPPQDLADYRQNKVRETLDSAIPSEE